MPVSTVLKGGSRPITLVNLDQAQRDAVVVTAVTDDLGNEYPLSRLGDAIWRLSTEIAAKNMNEYDVTIVWPADLPKAMIDDVKAALYCAMQRGGIHGQRWNGGSVARLGQAGLHVLRYLASLNLRSFSEVRALHLSDYISDEKQRVQPGTVRNRLRVIDLVWTHYLEMLHPLPEHPWSGQNLSEACGRSSADGPSGRTGKTPVIPRSVQRALFALCEERLERAEELFRARDAGEIPAFSYQLTAVRTAILYLVQITSGMRNSESTGIRSDCWRTEYRNGATFHWVRTREIKTKQGDVDFLVPPETIGALEMLQRYATPLQARLADERSWLENLLKRRSGKAAVLSNGMPRAEAARRLKHVREIGDHLFLAVSSGSGTDHLGLGSRVEVMTNRACNLQLKGLARAANVDWDLANHQCRRTFAYNVANSRMGRMGLVFLKWQLKHASISWTQLYASNPYQDHALYREFEDEMTEARLQLLEGWSDPDARLSGGAGRKMMLTRATPSRNLKSLLKLTAESIDLRSTGHAWCICGTRGCHGQGVYDPTMCAGCSQAVIDADQATSWQMIHMDNLRLAAITDCGPAATQKARRAIERSAQVLTDLGVPVPHDASTEAIQGCS